MRKNNRVALGSFLSRGTKVVLAPLTLLIIGNELSSQELAFYYSFFSLLAMQQLAELGIGQVIKQHMCHAFGESSDWCESSKNKIKSYFIFSLYWFLFISIFILLVICPIGYYYFNSVENTVNVVWENPWLALIVITTFSTILTPVKILIESCQKQELVNKANIISGIFGTFILWGGLYFDFKLYSISISLFVSTLIAFGILYRELNYHWSILSSSNDIRPLRTTFNEIKGLLGRVSIVWGLGFIFWNGFNFVSFLNLDLKSAGEILFTIALAKAGYSICDALVQGQMTIFGKNISEGKSELARTAFLKYFPTSVAILLFGYVIFVILLYFFKGNISVFNKVADIPLVIQIFLFFILMLIQTTHNNYIRSYKIEPFVIQSIILSFGNIISYHFALKFMPQWSFIPSCLLFGLVLIYNYNRFYRAYIYAKR